MCNQSKQQYKQPFCLGHKPEGPIYSVRDTSGRKRCNVVVGLMASPSGKLTAQTPETLVQEELYTFLKIFNFYMLLGIATDGMPDYETPNGYAARTAH